MSCQVAVSSPSTSSVSGMVTKPVRPQVLLDSHHSALDPTPRTLRIGLLLRFSCGGRCGALVWDRRWRFRRFLVRLESRRRKISSASADDRHLDLGMTK